MTEGVPTNGYLPIGSEITPSVAGKLVGRGNFFLLLWLKELLLLVPIFAIEDKRNDSYDQCCEQEQRFVSNHFTTPSQGKANRPP